MTDKDSIKANSGKIKKGEVRNPYGRKGKPVTNQSNAMSRKRLSSLAGQHFGGSRDLYQVMGYPRHLLPEDYADVYLRQDIAGRIVDAFPDATWREEPEVNGADDFIAAWNALEKKFNFYRTFHRLDRLAGLGHYSVLLLGLDGGEPMHTPAEGSDYNLIYLQPHSERTAQITHWNDDPTSARYGQPERYLITSGVNWTGSGASQRQMNVHHSRVIHVAERAMEDASIGVPRLERIYNRLMDLDKVMGGNAEMYWQNVAMMMAFIASADVDIEPESAAQMKDQMEEMQNGLRRFLQLQGVEAKNLAPGMQGSSPADTLDWLVKIIAGSEGIPQRILLGNEAGQLASSQDENAWAARIMERREQHVTPNMLDRFVTAGARLGFLPDGYEGITWPEADTLGEQGRADIADKKASALQKYVMSPGADMVVAPAEFAKWLNIDPATMDMGVGDDLDESDPQVISMMERRKRVR